MITVDHLKCGHCGCPLDICDCGVDQEIAYRSFREDLGQPKPKPISWLDMLRPASFIRCPK